MTILTEAQVNALKQVARAKGDVLEAAMAAQLRARGIGSIEAQQAARKCSNAIWRNSVISGAAAVVILGTMFTPVVGGIAGSSFGALSGIWTLTHSQACTTVRGADLERAVKELELSFL